MTDSKRRGRVLMRAIAGALTIAASWVAAAAQQTAEPPPGSLMVFFDWGKPDIRSDDAAVLDQVAAAWREKPGARLVLAGHTDRSGSSAFNRRAGLKRAEQVRNQLATRGVSSAAMAVISYGEERPLIPTEDGVREVQNRRVVIAFEE